jgi:hypothetical protein
MSRSSWNVALYNLFAVVVVISLWMAATSSHEDRWWLMFKISGSAALMWAYVFAGIIPTVRGISHKPLYYRGQMLKRTDNMYDISFLRSISLLILMPLMLGLFYYLHTH